MSTTQGFQFKFFNTLIMVFSVVLCLYLAYWQAGRIVEKQTLEGKYQQMLEAAPVDLNTLDNDGFAALAQQAWQTVRVEGVFLKEHAFFLDSQVYQGKPGYHYIVPLQIVPRQIVGPQQIILVNLGWIASGNRQDIPAFPAITTPQAIKGHLASPKSAMPGFEAQDINNKVQLFINMDALSDKISASDSKSLKSESKMSANINLAPMVILLDEDVQGGLPRSWPQYQAKIAMHEFYVIHWLLVALAIVLLYFYFAYKTPLAKSPASNLTKNENSESE